MKGIINLTDRVGFPTGLDLNTGEIDFGVPVERTFTRTLGMAVERGLVFKAEKIPEEKLSTVTTRIYRRINDKEISRIQGAEKDSMDRVKFDITVLLPSTVFGNSWRFEFPKTFGHYHKRIKSQRLASPDFYQIVHGRGLLLLQKREGKRVTSFLVEPKELDPVVIPPDYGHIAVNIGSGPLVFANICIREPHLDYSCYKNLNGGTHYFIRKRGGKIGIVQNKKYLGEGLSVSNLKRLKPNAEIPGHGTAKGKPIYNYIKERSPILGMLNRPGRHLDFFKTSLIH